MRLKSGSSPVNNSKGVFISRVEEGRWFHVNFACEMDSGQREMGVEECVREAVAFSTSVRHLRSAMPFCFEESGLVSCIVMPRLRRESCSSSLRNSPPWSHRMVVTR